MIQSIKEYLLPEEGKFKVDFFSGLTVALALIPEAIAFSLVAHLSPLVGLYSAFMMCLVTAVFGGRPGMISGATGSMAIVIVTLVSKHGVNYLFATVVLTGILQILVGIFKFGKYISVLPKSVMVGFVNGLAIIIFMAQLEQFKINVDGTTQWLAGTPLIIMGGLVILVMLITHYLPRFTKLLPSALVGIIVVTLIVYFGHVDTRDVNDMMAGYSGSAGFPAFTWLNIPFNMESLRIILPYALILTVIGLSESLMTLSLIDGITKTNGRVNKECLAQGAANITCGFFKGMGGCAMIGQSIINIKGGGRGRLSGITAAVMLLMFILFASSYIEQVPIAALVGVMFMVVVGTFAWSSFRIMNKIPKTDVFVLILVSSLTVIFDLAIAVVSGVIISALVFAWENAKKIRARKRYKEDGTKIYEIWGPLFFGSISAFNDKFDVKNDPESVEIDFVEARVSDHSAIEAIFALVEKYQVANKKIILKHLSEDCKVLLYKASPIFTDIIEEDIDDPRYHLAANPEDFTKPLGEYKF